MKFEVCYVDEFDKTQVDTVEAEDKASAIRQVQAQALVVKWCIRVE